MGSLNTPPPTTPERVLAAQIDGQIRDAVPVLLDHLEMAQVGASVTIYRTGTVQVTLKGDPVWVGASLSAWTDGLALRLDLEGLHSDEV